LVLSFFGSLWSKTTTTITHAIHPPLPLNNSLCRVIPNPNHRHHLLFSPLSMVLLSLNSIFDSIFYFDLSIFCYLIRLFFIFFISISSERCHQHAFSFALEVFSWFSFCSIIRFEDMDLVAGVKVYMIYWFMLQFHHHIILLLFGFYDYQFCWFWLILHVAL
jgi:hypothetical protein